MSKCPPEKRHIKKFEPEDRSRILVAIPYLESTRAFKAPHSDIARPNEIFDWLHENKTPDWHVTTTYLFPVVASQVKQSRMRRFSGLPCMLVSFGSPEDVMVFALSHENVVALPTAWWLLYENAPFKAHPLFPEFETTDSCLVRKNGQIIDVSYHTTMKIDRTFGGSSGLYREVRELTEDTWFR